MTKLRMSMPTMITLSQFMATPGPLCGYDIIKRTEIPSGTIYPLLRRLENAGWLTSRAEGIDPVKEGRPERMLYSITKLGKVEATKISERLQQFTKNN